MTTHSLEFWKQFIEEREEQKRRSRLVELERGPREKDQLDWGPETSEDDPYGELDTEYEELE